MRCSEVPPKQRSNSSPRHSILPSDLKRSGDNFVYRTVCWIFCARSGAAFDLVIPLRLGFARTAIARSLSREGANAPDGDGSGYEQIFTKAPMYARVRITSAIIQTGS
jgi:hypothetical protein